MSLSPLDNENIVLVVPPSHTHYVVPPIGLGYLATALRNEGFERIKILDCLKEGITNKSFGKNISLLNPKVIGFQVYSYDVNYVMECITTTKRILPDSVIILGGPHVSATQRLSLLEIPNADFAFVGEGEVGLPMLLKRLLRKGKIPVEDIPGLVYRKENAVYVNRRVYVHDLDVLGFPAWDLMVPGEYPDSPQGGFYKRFPIAPISTTRGCPYQCTFCGSNVNMGRKLRLRSISKVLSEIKMLNREYGVCEFHIIDDMFNFYKERVVEFCEGIKKYNLDIDYTFPNGLRLDHLDLEILQLMKATGAYAFNVGIESGSQRILGKMRKKLTLDQIEEKINLIVQAGLEPCGFFIIGFPGERVEDIKATIGFAKRLKIKRAHFSNFLPLPGTESTRNLIESGEIKKPAWETLFYSKVPYSPQGISKKQLKSWQRKAYLNFYLRPSILFKLLLEIKSINHFKITVKRGWDYLFKR